MGAFSTRLVVPTAIRWLAGAAPGRAPADDMLATHVLERYLGGERGAGSTAP